MPEIGRGLIIVNTGPGKGKTTEDVCAEAEKAIRSGEWDLGVLDEINYAISTAYSPRPRRLRGLKNRPEMVRGILSGRNAHVKIVGLADRESGVRQVKHAYEKGAMAQRGIEY